MAKPGLHLSVDCRLCGAAFRQARSDQVYCSGPCATKGWHKARREEKKPRPVRPCERCGGAVTSNSPIARFCSPACRYAAEAEKRKAARAVAGPGKRWATGREYVPRQACEQCGAAFYAPPVLMRRGGGRFCSVDCRLRWFAMHPETFPQTARPRGRGGKRDDLDGMYFRSAWEANYARYLNWLVSIGRIKAWEFEPVTFEFVGVRRGSRFYTPDFRVTENDGRQEYHEVKGWMDPRSATKLKRMAKYHPDVRVVVVDKDCYRDIARKIGPAIPGWETGTLRAFANTQGSESA